MSGEIWKYKVPREPVFPLSMPLGAQILHVAAVGSETFIWAQVNPEARSTQRVFHRRITGSVFAPQPTDKYLGTGLEDGGAFVVHIFERVS